MSDGAPVLTELTGGQDLQPASSRARHLAAHHTTDESEGLAIIDRQKIIKTTKTQIARAVISPFTLSYILCMSKKGKLIGRDRK